MKIDRRIRTFTSCLTLFGLSLALFGGLSAWVGFNFYIVATAEVGGHDQHWIQFSTVGKLGGWTIAMLFAVHRLLKIVPASSIFGVSVYLYLILAYNCIVILQFANAYKHLGLYQEGNRISDGPSSIYFSVVTWATLGYGDLTPSLEARYLAAFEALYGYTSMALLVGLLLWVLTRNHGEN